MNIALDEIRSKAPEGASHYSDDNIFSGAYYFKVVGNDVYIWELGKRFAITLRKFNEYHKLKPL